MTHYAYYKDNQFRIIPEGLMPNEDDPKFWGETDWADTFYSEMYNKALQHAKDQSVLAEDQRSIQHKNSPSTNPHPPPPVQTLRLILKFFQKSQTM